MAAGEAAVGTGPSPGLVALLSALVLVASLALLFIRKRASPPPADAPAEAASAAVEEEATPTVHIVYGTQTGTAERFSKALAAGLTDSFGGNSSFKATDVEQFNYKDGGLAKQRLVVFLMATYGEGEPTDTAVDFYEWAEEAANDENEPLQGVTFAVFGLGNREYEHFNAAGKTLHKALKAAGAAPLLDLGMGDDSDDIDDDFDKWKSTFFEALDRSGLIAPSETPVGEAVVYDYDVEVLSSKTKEAVPYPSGSGADAHNPYLARVVEVRELHGPASGRSCVHVEIDVKGASARYATGDHVGVFAANSDDVVAAAAARLGYDLDEIVTLSAPSAAADRLLTPPPPRLRVRTLLARFADLLNSPPKAALLALARHATDPSDAARLARLGSPEGKAEYASWVTAPHRSLLEVLDACPSAAPPLGAFFAHVAPRLAPRFYSISSSPAASGGERMTITAAVVDETTPGGRRHAGVASNHLASLRTGDRLPVFVRKSHFKLPEDPQTPLVMVGPGTGLAPFRGFIQERAAARSAGKALGPACLFFGCRHPEHDFIYREELEAAGLEEDGALSALHVAYSRLVAEKDYVQHHIEAHADQVWDMLGSEAKGVFYVCGDAKHMAKDVHRKLCETAETRYGCSKSEAENLVKALQDSGRYLRDVW